MTLSRATHLEIACSVSSGLLLDKLEGKQDKVE